MAYGPIFTLRAANIRDTVPNNGSGTQALLDPPTHAKPYLPIIIGS